MLTACGGGSGGSDDTDDYGNCLDDVLASSEWQMYNGARDQAYADYQAGELTKEEYNEKVDFYEENIKEIRRDLGCP